MRAAALIIALVGLNACSEAIVRASFNSNTVVPPPPGTISGGHATVRVLTTNGAAAIAGMLFIAAVLDAEGTAHARPYPSFSSTYAGFWGTPAPELDPDRHVNEQDCTKSVVFTGNLKCR